MMFPYCNFLKISKTFLLKTIEKLDGNGKLEKKLSCNLSFPLPDVKLTLKQLSGTVLKIHVRKKIMSLT